MNLLETILGTDPSNGPASTEQRHGGVPDAATLAALLDAIGALLSRTDNCPEAVTLLTASVEFRGEAGG